MAGSAALFAFWSLATFRRTLHPANWLLRVSGERLWIKFRSYLNDQFPADEVQIVQLGRAEVAWVKPVKVRTTVTNRQVGAVDTTTWLKYLEIGLVACDTTALRECLQRERQHASVGNRFIQSKPTITL